MNTLKAAVKFRATIIAFLLGVFGVVWIANSQSSSLNTTAALFRSENNGEAWTKIPVPQTEPQNLKAPNKHMGSTITGLVADPRNAKTLFATVVARTQTVLGTQMLLSSRSTLLRSTNRGKTWEEIHPLGDRVDAVLAVDPSDSSKVYVSTGGTLIRSTDSGRSWLAGISINIAPLKGIAVDPSDGKTLYAFASSAILKTSNSGKNWTSAFLDVGAISSLVIDPRDSKTLYVGTARGVVKSSDGGQSWIGSSSGLGQSSVVGIAIDPSNSSILFAAASTAGRATVYKSTDRGASWTVSNSQMEVFVPRGIAVAGTNPSNVYVWGERSIGFKSVDAGATWTTLSGQYSPSTEVSALAVDPQAPTAVYIATKTLNLAGAQANPR
jgi:photosystem II stability/assembly factor-like uncharacterized protein